MIYKKALIACLFAISLSGCADMRGPSMSGSPEKMSSDTLCYRNEVRPIPEFKAEIVRRNIDCKDILQDDPLLIDKRY